MCDVRAGARNRSHFNVSGAPDLDSRKPKEVTLLNNATGPSSLEVCAGFFSPVLMWGEGNPWEPWSVFDV